MTANTTEIPAGFHDFCVSFDDVDGHSGSFDVTATNPGAAAWGAEVLAEESIAVYAVDEG